MCIPGQTVVYFTADAFTDPNSYFDLDETLYTVEQYYKYMTRQSAQRVYFKVPRYTSYSHLYIHAGRSKMNSLLKHNILTVFCKEAIMSVMIASLDFSYYQYCVLLMYSIVTKCLI